MVYITFDPDTGVVDPVAYSEYSLVPSDKSSMEISSSEWVSAQGKDMKVEKGVFSYTDPLPTVKDYDKAVEDHLRAERVARGYTMREPSDYQDSTVPRWAQDAADWIAHRDAVMLYALEVMNHYAETGEAPTLEDFRAALPVIAWTAQDEAPAAPEEVADGAAEDDPAAEEEAEEAGSAAEEADDAQVD